MCLCIITNAYNSNKMHYGKGHASIKIVFVQVNLPIKAKNRPHYAP